MTDIIIPTTMARGAIFVSIGILYSLACNAIDVIDDDNFESSPTAQILISVALIETVGMLSIESIV